MNLLFSLLTILTSLALLTITAAAQNQTNAQLSTFNSQRSTPNSPSAIAQRAPADQPLALPKPGEGGSTNRVLDLDGKGSYVELPPNIFICLEEGTVNGSTLTVIWTSDIENAGFRGRMR